MSDPIDLEARRQRYQASLAQATPTDVRTVLSTSYDRGFVAGVHAADAAITVNRYLFFSLGAMAGIAFTALFYFGDKVLP